MKKDPKKDVDACHDFLLIIVKGHLLAAACTQLGVQKLDLPLTLPSGTYKKSSEEQYTFLEEILTQVVNNFTVVDSALTGGCIAESGDGVRNYARVLCHYSGEGDGPCVYCCWRMFLPHFFVANRQKYATEALCN